MSAASVTRGAAGLDAAFNEAGLDAVDLGDAADLRAVGFDAAGLETVVLDVAGLDAVDLAVAVLRLLAGFDAADFDVADLLLLAGFAVVLLDDLREALDESAADLRVAD